MKDKMLPWQKTFTVWMKDKKLSLSAAARALGIPVSLAFLYREGQSAPSLSRLAKFSAVLGISKDRLIGILVKDSIAKARNRRNKSALRVMGTNL